MRVESGLIDAEAVEGRRFVSPIIVEGGDGIPIDRENVDVHLPAFHRGDVVVEHGNSNAELSHERPQLEHVRVGLTPDPSLE
jgi:hypothetical protein